MRFVLDTRQHAPRPSRAPLLHAVRFYLLPTFIAEKSGHSRGSTVDLTIVYRGAGDAVLELDMGSGYDLFGPVSWPDSGAVTGQQRANRTLLQQVMSAHGFTPYAREWWHFTFADEPFPDTYFDFSVDAVSRRR